MAEHRSFVPHRANTASFLGVMALLTAILRYRLATPAFAWTPPTNVIRRPLISAKESFSFPRVTSHHVGRSGPSASTLRFSVALDCSSEGGRVDEGDSDDDPATPKTNPLERAGWHMGVIDARVGDALIAAGRAWSSDWSMVAESLEDASAALRLLSSSPSSHANWRALWEAVALELHDASTIEGCSSVGPPSSLPNWVAIHDLLDRAVADADEAAAAGGRRGADGEPGEGPPDDVPSIVELTREAIRDLISSI